MSDYYLVAKAKFAPRRAPGSLLKNASLGVKVLEKGIIRSLPGYDIVPESVFILLILSILSIIPNPILSLQRPLRNRKSWVHQA